MKTKAAGEPDACRKTPFFMHFLYSYRVKVCVSVWDFNMLHLTL